MQDWLFADGWRERWIFRQFGTRHLLIRLAAPGDVSNRADLGFETREAQAWFDEVVNRALIVD